MRTNDIKAMRRVSAYRTTDDRVHEKRNDAVRWQARLDLCALIARAIPGEPESTFLHDIVQELINENHDVHRLLRATQKGL